MEDISTTKLSIDLVKRINGKLLRGKIESREAMKTDFCVVVDIDYKINTDMLTNPSSDETNFCQKVIDEEVIVSFLKPFFSRQWPHVSSSFVLNKDWLVRLPQRLYTDIITISSMLINNLVSKNDKDKYTFQLNCKFII